VGARGRRGREIGLTAPRGAAQTDTTAAAGEWTVRAAASATRFVNPIRAIVDTLTLAPTPDKPAIHLSIGDPTTFGNLPPPPEAVAAVQAALLSGQANGYAKSVGYDHARAAIAAAESRPGAPLTAEQVVIASGCSGALDLAISALADAGSNILIPAPGFSLYKTLAAAKGVETRSYRCLPERGWEADLAQMAALVDARTAAIVVTNPSNPCGSVFARAHLEAIGAVARAARVPLIADEIYADMVFPGAEFHALAALAPDVPVLSCGGIAKRFLVPGWRLGWVAVHDRGGALARGGVPGALVSLSQLILGANTLVQAALPALLRDTPAAFFRDTMATLERHARLCHDALAAVPGLRPIMPRGAMYMMVGVDVAAFGPEIADDKDFTRLLAQEQCVSCLPAAIFDCPNFFRIVVTVPEDMLAAAMARITAFCAAHRA
jgi:tyrosine aminotransferase